MGVGSDTFGDPFIQKVFKISRPPTIIGILECFAKLCSLVKKCQNLTFKVNFLRQKSSASFWFFKIKNIGLGAHFLLKLFFVNLNFWTNLNSKGMFNFWQGLKAMESNWGRLTQWKIYYYSIEINFFKVTTSDYLSFLNF